MKKKVREALKEVRNGMFFGKVDFDNLETLVKWAEKKAKVPEKLEVGDKVKLTKDIELSLAVLPKGATGTVNNIDTHDPFDVDVTMDAPCPYRALGFRFSELEKVESNV